ncbi:hypothetical protein H6G97_19395 [Nostoc flagelliforme FACHB-838]|uniref:Uncharacterized protein n=1 Tax=Nostoc flagelliforme FACHB-838 TaxID=2692904 RepID=A0ABR8DQ95_9NOSO|nr:hypothetical protein [Nostoc flagelliforme]MBD2531639.1 hypothetical protein [Nostoc flagelliforme FACHB-838]
MLRLGHLLASSHHLLERSLNFAAQSGSSLRLCAEMNRYRETQSLKNFDLSIVS